MSMNKEYARHRLAYWKQKANRDKERMEYYLELAKMYKTENNKQLALHTFADYKMFRQFYNMDLRMVSDWKKYYDNGTN